jgi:hypothetical protein
MMGIDELLGNTVGDENNERGYEFHRDHHRRRSRFGNEYATVSFE